jgi:Heterokaryon incompatibility protein (HET)
MSQCSICLDLDLKQLIQRPSHEFEPNEIVIGLSTINQSAKHCDICQILRSGLSAFCDENVLGRYENAGLRIIVLENLVKARFPDFKADFEFIDLEYFTQIGSYSPFGSGLALSQDPDCTKNYQMIGQAITNCISEHPRCQPASFEASGAPMRLLVLDGTDSFKLCKPMGQQLKYAALSHCWGVEPLLRLTKSTVRNAQGEIEFQRYELPKSFQDAERVSRGLGIHYLWIDSLCIVQDDELDWEREAAKMGSIYEGAYITIAATSTIGSTNGFLDGRGYKRIRAKDLDVDVYVRQYQYKLMEDLEMHHWLFRADHRDSHCLLRRGWCF